MAERVGLGTLNEASLVWAITTVPIKGEDGETRIGGTGETTVAKTYANLFGAPVVIGFGAALRELCAVQLGKTEPTEPEFETWRASLVANGSFELDQQVDVQLQQLAADRATGLEPAVVASKLLGFLWKGKPVFVALGVEVEDEVATRRMWGRNLKNDPDVTEESVAVRRAGRFITEQSNFLACYGIDYSPETVAGVVDFVFDNTPNRNPQDLQAEAQRVLQQAVDGSLSLAASLFTYTGVMGAIPALQKQVETRIDGEVRLGDVLDLLRIRFQRIIGNAEPAIDNIKLAWQAYAAWHQLWKALDDYKLFARPENNMGVTRFAESLANEQPTHQAVFRGITRDFRDSLTGRRAYSGGVGYVLMELPEEIHVSALGFCEEMINFAKKYVDFTG